MSGREDGIDGTSDVAPLPLAEGLFRLPSSPFEKPYLLGSHCCSCGETFFPPRRHCRRCSSDNLEEIKLSQTAKLYSFTTIRERLPGAKVDFPSVVGVVELSEGEKIRTLLAECDQESLRIGDEMELVIETVYKDESGRDVLGWKFKPLRREEK